MLTSTLSKVALCAGLILVLGGPRLDAQKPARPERARARVAASPGFSLFAGLPQAQVFGNRVYCGLTDVGNICTDVSNSPVLGGGSWPFGTPDQYIFKSGVQIAGIIPASAGFAWAGDTVGAWAIDTRGPAEHMSTLTGLYDSRRESDTASWPEPALVRDTSLYHPSLIGGRAASRQDTWTRYWDGDPTRITGREHSAGLLVEQRTLQFGWPAGAEDVLFVVYRLTNITARDASAYQGLSAAGYSAADISAIAALGAEFQSLAEPAFTVQIPDAGYTIGNMFIGFSADMDIGDATNNYSSAALPFALSLAYKSDFRQPTWQFPAEVFNGPFAAAPGFVGAQLLRTPGNNGLFLHTGYGNSGAGVLVNQPANVPQGYRTMNGTVGPAYGDFNACQYPPARQLCALPQSPADQRTMLSTGPFTLAPGQSVVYAMAYVFAPALSSNPGRPSYDINQYLGNTTMVPGVPPGGARLVQGLDTLRVLDAALGWVSHADANASGAIEASEVVTVRGSLLHKAQVAQALFDNKFARPEAPLAPEFLLVPGSDQVTIVWKPSATETTGDPYWDVASVASGALHDPNYRRFDVEGYRLWRGTSPDHLELVAQFDYSNTVFADYTGDVYSSDYLDNLNNGEYRCAPELGITASCPVAFATAPPYVNHQDTPIHGPFLGTPGVVQVYQAGRSRLANDPGQYARGALRVDRADTAVTGGGSGFEPPLESGVPFVYVDNTARNGNRYYYAVTVFDVNSLRSGPSSLESAPAVRGVTPRVASGQTASGAIGTMEFVRRDGSVVPRILVPDMDVATGRFAGPMAQTDMSLTVDGFVPELVSASGSVDVYVDSVVPGTGTLNASPVFPRIPGAYHLRIATAAGADTLVVPFNVGYLSQQLGTPDFRFSTTFDAIVVDSAQAARYGVGAGFALPATLSFTVPGAFRLTEWGRGDANADPSRSSFNGPRWWSGAANENTNHPNSGHCAPSVGNCGSAPLPAAGPSAGSLAGVTTLMHVLGYSTVPSSPQRDLETITAHITRAADFAVHWGSGGTVDSVVDRTHGVPVPFKDRIRASWGFLTGGSFAAVIEANTRDGRNAVLTWGDIYCVNPVPAFMNECGGSTAPLVNTATLTPIAAATSSAAGLATLPASGNGFIFYLNGHFFLMQMASLPASGTVWNARFYSGTVRTASQAVPGNYSFVTRERPPAVPGLHLRISYTGSSFAPSVSVDSVMQRIHTVPDPYYGLGLSQTPGVPAQIRFVNVPSQAVIRIYSSSGLLTALLTNNDPTGGGEVIWDVKSRGGRLVASGVYFYHVEAPDGRTKIGRLTIVQ